MSDYLFDRDGPPDPEVARLERLLESYRYRGAPAAPPRRLRRRLAIASAALLAAAASVAAFVWLRRPAGEVWAVESLAGRPTCGSSPCARLAPGEALQTDPASRARVQVGKFGYLDIEPDTTIRRRASVGQERLALLHGTVSARVAAPPRLLVVETASAHAVDLGCAYTLTVDEHGTGRLRVTSGWVALEAPDGSVIVPRGAEAALHSGGAPGTPVFSDAPGDLRAALEAVDAGLATGRIDRPALDRVLGGVRPRDTLSLFNLLPRMPAGERAVVLDRMLALGATIPRDISRAALLAADDDALELWRESLSDTWL